MRRASVFLAAALTLAGSARGGEDAPAHGRPYFMPETERRRIRGLIERHEWAKAEHARMTAAAREGKGFEAAFLHALEGDAKHIPAARAWLLKKYGPKAPWVSRYAGHLADPNHFKAGMPHLADVYYNLDISGLLGFDWAYTGLAPADRKTIEEGILTVGRYRIRAMGRWTQTANLVFKPTYMVAMTGLATEDRQCLAWGFHRKPRRDGGHAGYFGTIDRMLRDGGPWHEAPIYPIAHTGLLCMARMSRLRGLYDGVDWFAREAPSGGSPKGLMDYYIDTAYPIEPAGGGGGPIRVATYGDGATGPGGDLFLVNPAGGGLTCHEALAAAYGVSGDRRYARFVAMIPGYKPDLLGHRPVPGDAEFPPAASKVWPTYGLAMLRSDESPAYWTSGEAIAVFQLMSQGYGHDHRDKFAICLHGAGRLFYPDYNAIQYENQAIGWTRNSVCHNTLVVDGRDAQNAAPTAIRHDLAPEVKFLAVSASGVFEGVDQTRCLLLTREYLLDVFRATSEVPHAYDYLLHSFGKARPGEPNAFAPSRAMRRRYWLVEGTRGMTTGQPWWMDLVIEAAPGEGGPATARGDHKATLRVTMAGEPDTLVVHGVWGRELARLVAERFSRKKGAPGLHHLTMLAARRAGCRSTVFVSTHEPFAGSAKPKVKAVATLARSADAIAARVDARDFTDYIVVGFAPQRDRPVRVLAAGDTKLCFRNYGYLRVRADGSMVARGGWTGFRVQHGGDRLSLNGKPAAIESAAKGVVFGDVSQPPDPAAATEPECPFAMSISPPVLRVSERDHRPVTFSFTNTLAKAVSGRIELELPEGFSTQPEAPTFGPVRPGGQAQVRLALIANRPRAGEQTVPCRLVYRTEGGEEIRTAAVGLKAAAGPTLELVYRHPKPAVYRVHSPKYTAEFDMYHGLCRHLADDDGAVRLEGRPLFTFSDGERPMLFEGTEKAFTWPRRAPADLLAHAYDRCRWRAVLMGDRITVRMDRNWTQFGKAHFTVPGRWVSPAGKPVWNRIVALRADGTEHDARPGKDVKVVAAELAFPEGKWHLAFHFSPPQEVTFDGMKLTFRIGCLAGESWSAGFIRPGGLDEWRGRREVRRSGVGQRQPAPL